MLIAVNNDSLCFTVVLKQLKRKKWVFTFWTPFIQNQSTLRELVKQKYWNVVIFKPLCYIQKKCYKSVVTWLYSHAFLSQPRSFRFPQQRSVFIFLKVIFNYFAFSGPNLKVLNVHGLRKYQKFHLSQY